MEIFNLLEENWGTAVILDACRYDMFKSTYPEYIEGGRLERRTGATCTTHWLRSVFRENNNDLIYVSGNPWINSVTGWDGFNPSEKFEEIWDVWDWAWDEERETVPPKYVTKAALRARKEHPDKRIIAHYLQPHYPYLDGTVPEKVRMYFEGVNGRSNGSGHITSSLGKFVDRSLERWLGRSRHWGLREFLKVDTNRVEEYLWRKYSADQLKSLYEKNLRRVLSEVSKLLDRSEERVIITSDHGEAFGEKGDFFHPYGTKNPVVRHVPYWRPS